jgi:ubiquinone biosynthesis protein UbiJ
VLTGDEAKAAEADNLQAQLLRQCLGDERRKLAAKLAKHARMLNETVTSQESRTISHHRGSIRQLEREIWSINRMVDALNTRFPTPGSADELSLA